MHFQPAERNLQNSITQTQSSAAVVPDRKVLRSFPSKARGTGIRASGPCVLVTQSFAVSEGTRWMTPDPTAAQSTGATLPVAEGCPSPCTQPASVSGWQKHTQLQDGGAELKESLQQADSEARQGWFPVDQL